MRRTPPSGGSSHGWLWVPGLLLAGVILVGWSLLRDRPASREVSTGRSERPAEVVPVRPIDVNKATLEELRSLPRVSDEMAKGIVAGRPYRTIDELKRVYGIGPKTLERLRPLVTVETPPTGAAADGIGGNSSRERPFP